MGELVNLQKYRERKDEEECREIAEDIARLQAELREMIGDMEEYGTALWHTAWIEQLPALIRIDEALDGYAMASRDLDDSLDKE